MRFYLADTNPAPRHKTLRAAAQEALALDADPETVAGKRTLTKALKNAKAQHRRCRLCSLESLMWADAITRFRDLLGITGDMLAKEVLKHGCSIH